MENFIFCARLESYLEPCQMYVMDLFVNIVDAFQLQTIATKKTFVKMPDRVTNFAYGNTSLKKQHFLMMSFFEYWLVLVL